MTRRMARVDLPADVDLLRLHRHAPQRFPFLLESVAAHAQSGRYDILFADPCERIIGAQGFEELSRQSAALPPTEADGLPFVGGWFLLLGYEAAAYVEPSLRLPASPFRLPPFLAVRCTAAIIHDRERKQLSLIVEGGAAQLDSLRAALDSAPALPSTNAAVHDLREDEPEQFLRGVARIRNYLRAGDAFQVNLSRGWHARMREGTRAADLYARLREMNPAPFAGIADVDGVQVISSSPERLVQVQDGVVQTRPIAGTRPRAQGDADAALRAQLIGNLKERAEHVMLIDLERNDLGRVCEPGSIEVNELMSLESYAYVHHIVSNLRGRLRAGVGPGEVLRAVFPGGTITGCPKLRAMQIIAELEGVGRGPYTGAMGYLSRCGRMDTNILIRSLLLQDGVVSLRAGAGIVADSDPESELAETRAKARGLLLALGASA